jgi:hypothetical protein
MELMDQPQVVKEQQLINSNSLITSYKNLAKKYTNLCLTYIPKDLLCSHDEVDMLTSSIVNDNAPCLIFSEIFMPHVEIFIHLHHSGIPVTLKATAEACAPAVLSFPSLSSSGFVLSKS